MEEHSEYVKEKIAELGSDTIMGAALNEEMNASVDKLQEAIEENAEKNEEVNKAAITGNNLSNMMYYQKTRPIVRDYKKIGRNDPCPCGSGDKYKNCCMDSGKYETTHFE